MERSQRVANLWNWLPHFRAVAETEHLPTASKAMNASASALSRSIRLLEEDVGRPLFDRVGRNIHLNANGQALLAAVRGAMRLVHEGVQAASGDQLRGPVHVSIPGPFAPFFVLPAFEKLREDNPHLLPSIRSASDRDIPALLLRGQIDIAVSDAELDAEELAVDRLYDVEHAIFCAGSHPLTDVSTPTPEEVLAHPFVAPECLPDGRRPDAFPMGMSRIVGLEVDQMNVAIESCKRGTYLGCFPVLVAEAAGLERVPFTELPTTHLYILRRPPVADTSRADVVAAAIEEAAAKLAKKRGA